MCTFTIQDVANAYGVSKSTAQRHIKTLKIKKKFKKSAIGKFYNEIDLQNLSILLGFTHPTK